MNDKMASQQPTHIILDSDGSPDSVISLMYFLQHPAISVDALTVSYGLAYPDTYTAIFARILARLNGKLFLLLPDELLPSLEATPFQNPFGKWPTNSWGSSCPK